MSNNHTKQTCVMNNITSFGNRNGKSKKPFSRALVVETRKQREKTIAEYNKRIDSILKSLNN